MAPPTSKNKWGVKLRTKLSVLTEASSKESLQALAMWIFFNRKHKEAFVETLRESLSENQQSRNIIVLSVLHEVLMLHSGDRSKWEQAADLRLILGESVLLSRVSSFPSDRISSLLATWDTQNVFDGPTLIHQIRKAIAPSAAASPPQKQVVEPHPPSQEQPKTSTLPSTISTAILEPTKTKASAVSPAANTSNPSPTNPKNVIQSYDFESKGVPAKPLHPVEHLKELMDPCRAIATLQIARDLRSDTAVQLSSLLQSMPLDIREFTAAAAENGGAFELSDEQARDYCLRVPPQLLDDDLQREQMSNVQTLKDLVERQKAAREQLLQLLLQSRCRFGADEIAAAYYAIDDSVLRHRTQILADAMELEGLEVLPGSASAADQGQELPPLSWYQPTASESKESGSPHKRQKIDD